MAASGLLQSYGIGDTDAERLRPDGVRVVVRGDGRWVDVVASPSSSYLLPDLAEFSLVKREARLAGMSRIMLCGNTVRVDKLSDSVDDAGLRPLSQVAGDWGLGLGPPSTSSIVGVGGKLLMRRTFDRPVGLPAERRRATRSRVMATAPEPIAATPAILPLAADAPVAAVASRIAALAELGDERLADLFKVERETFCRWRTGALANPRLGNRRRLSLLLSLLEDLSTRGVRIRDWLLNHTTAEGLTPYQLMEQGKIDEVAYLASALGEPVTSRDARVAFGREEAPLEFGDDDVWEPQVLDDDG